MWCLRLKYPAALRVFHVTAPELRADVPGGTPLRGCCVVLPSEVPGGTLVTHCSLSSKQMHPKVLAVSLTEAAVLCWCPKYPAVLGLLSAH